MTVISVTSYKGGVGKSTITQNLSVGLSMAGANVAIYDSDYNQSAVKWGQNRARDEDNLPMTVYNRSDDVFSDIKEYRSKHDLLLLDGRPGHDKNNSALMALADIIIHPITAGFMELDQINPFMKMMLEVTEHRNTPPIVYFVMNKVNKNRKNVMNYTGKALSLFSESTDRMEVFSNYLQDYDAYQEASALGLSVLELKKDKANAQFTEFTKEVFNIIKGIL